MDISREKRGVIESSRKAKLSARLEVLRQQVTALLVQQRQTVFLGIVALVVLAEVIEHLLIVEFGQRAYLLFDAMAYAVLVPAAMWVLLGLLERTESERLQAAQSSSINLEFNQQLGNTRTWEELIRLIVTYPRRVSPNAATILYILNGSMHMEPEALCTRDGEIVHRPEVPVHPDSLPVGSLQQLLLQNGGSSSSMSANISYRYDLPITRNDQQIGVLKLEFPGDAPPSQAEIRALKSNLPVVALALERALLQNVAVEQANTTQAQRQEIAQNLHDTLAQNISYLRLKLDQLTGENAIREIGVVLQELEQMRATADEAYQQVRDTLDELNPIYVGDLMELLKKQAWLISRRSNLSLKISQVGSAYPLPAATRQQVLYIVREALHNVEKHARASEVHLQFLWLPGEMIIKLTDDGVGFNPLSIPAEGHYGLWIMQHRAQEIGGTLKVCPAESRGTEITLWVPRPGHAGGSCGTVG